MNSYSNLKKDHFFLTRRRLWPVFFLLLGAFYSCAPREAIQFRSVKNIVVDTGTSGEPLLKGDAVFYNPNHVRMKLKEIRVEVWVNGKKSALVDQKPDVVIPGASEFSVSIEARLSLKEIGLLDTMLDLFGGKKYEMEYRGYLRIRLHGITVKVPIQYKNEVKLKI